MEGVQVRDALSVVFKMCRMGAGGKKKINNGKSVGAGGVEEAAAPEDGYSGPRAGGQLVRRVTQRRGWIGVTAVQPFRSVMRNFEFGKSLGVGFYVYDGFLYFYMFCGLVRL